MNGLSWGGALHRICISTAPTSAYNPTPPPPADAHTSLRHIFPLRHTLSPPTQSPSSNSTPQTHTTMASLGKAIGATSALEGQPQTHQHLVSTQPTSPGALFMLPPELRREIYKGLLPPRKIVKARGAYNYPGRPKKWTFYSLNAVSQPLLTQLCKETRDFILQKGTFIFNDGKEEGGLWWDPENVCCALSSPARIPATPVSLPATSAFIRFVQLGQISH